MAGYPPYNEVFGIATHNSYWIDRSDLADFSSSGTQELISDQLLHEHVRGLEIDVHSQGSAPGQWKVYHTSDSEDFLGRYLEDYLEYLRNFQYALPDHEVINIIIELKNVVPSWGSYDATSTVAPNFDGNHTMDQFDDTFRRYLGPWLYTPDMFLARNRTATNMVDVASSVGWPVISDLRGMFIVNVIGNWSTAAADWVDYAASDMRNRVAFPMQSVFEVQPGTFAPPESRFLSTRQWFQASVGGTGVWIRDIDETLNPSPDIPQPARQAALDASVFWQFEAVKSPFALSAAANFIGRGGVIRCADSFEFSEQLSRLANRFQLVQTDYPWHVVNDEAPFAMAIPTDPSRRFRDLSWAAGPPGDVSGAYHEPGVRFYAHTTMPAEIWAYSDVPADSGMWWETTVSTTRHGDTTQHNYPRRAQDVGTGAIRAQSGDGQNSIVVVRHKETQPGDSYYQEKVMVGVIVVKDGHMVANPDLAAARYGPCKRDNDPNSSDVSSICIGSLIALSVVNTGQGATAAAYSAGRTSADGTPDWQWIGQWTFDQPLSQQGFSGAGDVLFVGARAAGALGPGGLPTTQPSFVRLSDLPGRRTFNATGAAAQFVDLTDPFVPCATTVRIRQESRQVHGTCLPNPPLLFGENVVLGVETNAPDVSNRPDIADRGTQISWTAVGADIIGPANKPSVAIRVADGVEFVTIWVKVADQFGCAVSAHADLPACSPENLRVMDEICRLIDQLRLRIDRFDLIWNHLPRPDPPPDAVVQRLRDQFAKEIRHIAALADQTAGALQGRRTVDKGR